MSLKRIITSLILVSCLMVGKNASALSDYCATLVYPAFTLECTTLEIPANAANHFIRYEAGPLAQYRLRDVSLGGLTVRAGIAGWNGKRETVPGLVGWYTLTVKHAGATYGYISNT
jgi:hypothetical protein